MSGANQAGGMAGTRRAAFQVVAISTFTALAGFWQAHRRQA